MKTVLNAKVDADLKRQAQKLAKQLGIPLSLVVNGSLREFVQSRAITVSDAPQPSPYLEKIIAEFEEDYAKGRNMSPKFDSVEEMMAYLKQSR